MKRLQSRWGRAAISLVLGVLALAMIAALISGVGWTACFDYEPESLERVIFQRDNVLVSLLLLGAGVLICRFLSAALQQVSPGKIAGISLALTFLLGSAWVWMAQAVPINDAGILYFTAKGMAQGDPGLLWTHADYYRANTHQAGFLLYAELCQRVFGRGSILPQGLFNVAFLTGACAALLHMLWLSAHNRRALAAAALLMPLCAQGLLFCTFQYGVLPGLCLGLWSLDFVLAHVRGRRLGWLAVPLMALAAALKQNYLILAVALAGGLLLYAISARRLSSLVLAAALAAAAWLGPALCIRVVEARTGFSFSPTLPKTTWLAMGMQDGPLAPGWYNRYPLNLLAKTGGGEAASRVIHEDIAARLSEFRADPQEALAFYRDKFVSQWSESTWESIFLNRVMPGRGAALLSDVPALETWMEGYALALYVGFAAGLLLWAVRLWRFAAPWDSLFAPLVLAIGVLGGLLFHMLFEAKSQYLFPYAMMMLPLAAMGLTAEKGALAPAGHDAYILRADVRVRQAKRQNGGT